MNEDKNNTQANEKDETMTAEVIIDEDFISVPRTRYDELLRAEVMLEVIGRFYRKPEVSPIELHNVVSTIFAEGKRC